MRERPSDKVIKSVPLWAQIIVWIFIFGLLTFIAFGLSKSKNPLLKNGSEVPDFKVPLFEGYEYKGESTLTLSSLRGKVVVLNFWASWCKPCESEAAELESAWRYYKSKERVLFLGIDYVDTEPEARSYLAKFDITYPNGPDMATQISQIFNRNLGVPETYIIDQQGVLRYKKIGPFVSLEEIISVIESVLSGD